MVSTKNLKIHSFADLYEVRELWYINWADMWGDQVGYGAQTRNVHEDNLIGVFTSEKLANKSINNREKAVREKLGKRKSLDMKRVLSGHGIFPKSQETGNYDFELRKRIVPLEELKEKKGVLYWDRPINVFNQKYVDKDGIARYDTQEYVPTVWVFDNVERDPARLIEINSSFELKI